MTDRKRLSSLPPQATAAILEILNAGNDVKITVGKTGITVCEVSTKRKYIENAVASGRQ